MAILRVSNNQGPSMWRSGLFCCWFLLRKSRHVYFFVFDVLDAGNVCNLSDSQSTVIIGAGIYTFLLIGTRVWTKL